MSRRHSGVTLDAESHARVTTRADARVGSVNTMPPTPVRTALTMRLLRLAPMLLALSIAARFAWTYLMPNGDNFVDLHVYVGGAAALDEPGALYHYEYGEKTPGFPLPFTYPPFAAVVFYPLHLLPFGLVAFGWQALSMAALYAVVRISQRLLNRPGHRLAMLWTAVGIWTEPVRSTLDYGQVNILLVLAVLYAVYSSRWWLSGLLVGVAAGVKLTRLSRACTSSGPGGGLRRHSRRWRSSAPSRCQPW